MQEHHGRARTAFDNVQGATVMGGELVVANPGRFGQERIEGGVRPSPDAPAGERGCGDAGEGHHAASEEGGTERPW